MDAVQQNLARRSTNPKPIPVIQKNPSKAERLASRIPMTTNAAASKRPHGIMFFLGFLLRERRLVAPTEPDEVVLSASDISSHSCLKFI